MTTLIIAALVFLGLHLIVSGTKLRDAITSAIGEGPYTGLFSVASIAAIFWLAVSYNRAQASGADPLLYNLGPAVGHLGIPVVALAFFLGLQGLMSPNPTAVRQEALAAKDTTVRGVIRITRHPFLWGVAIWAAFHLAANGDEASVVLFGSLLLLSVLGTFSIDAKRKRKMGAQWDAFAARTSNVPFAAVMAGRNRLHIGESFGWRFWVTVVVFLVVLFSHARVIGASPFPGGWAPF
jgi:uncharacterized membrane protein